MIDTANSFGSFAVKDIAAAKRFYEDTLGIEVTEENDLLGLHVGGGHAIVVYPKPDHAPAVFTVLNLSVGDIDAAVDELAGRGVEFERYEGTDLATDEKGIFRGGGPLIAWFKDPSGNVMSVIQGG
jgi:catechol 2,3-dioxygenase-like lactoylglutathione lyase family enzyme